jgi:hypothetical protein
MHIKRKICKNKYFNFFLQTRQQPRWGLTLGLAYLMPDGWLDRSQSVSGRSCGRPNISRFFVVFLGPRAKAELVPKFHVALHDSHAALPKFRHIVGLPMLDQISLHFKRYVTKLISFICGASTRRTSWHCLVTFKIGNKPTSPPPNAVSLGASPRSLPPPLQ